MVSLCAPLPNFVLALTAKDAGLGASFISALTPTDLRLGDRLMRPKTLRLLCVLSTAV